MKKEWGYLDARLEATIRFSTSEFKKQIDTHYER